MFCMRISAQINKYASTGNTGLFKNVLTVNEQGAGAKRKRWGEQISCSQKEGFIEGL